MDKKNALLIEGQNVDEDAFDFDELEERLQSQLEEQLSELDFLENEKEQIGNPDALGDTIKNVVWEQFLNQVAVTAGEDFIEANRGLTLDLRSEAHIQTTENFANGKFASHNTHIDYKQRYDDWQSNFKKDENGEVITKPDNRTGKEKEVLAPGARVPFDKDRPKGSATVDMDHTVSAAEIIRDPGTNAHMTKEEQINFANSEKNLNPLDSAANRSKSDSTMEEWLDSERDGQKPADRFNIDEEQLRKKDKEAREEYETQKKEGEERSIKAGKQSQKEEAFRIGGKALRAVAMQLLAEFVKEIIGKLVKWFKYKQKSLYSLIESLKTAIKSFVGKLKTHLIKAGNTLITTIATAIIGPVVGTIKKVWMMLKQGWKSLKEAVAFLRNPANKERPMGLKLLEVGKIVMAGLSGTVAIVLGEVIEKGLMSVPVLAIEIPLLGSLANIIGIFMGAVVAGIIGAIAINLIDEATAKKRKAMVVENQVDKGNEILETQRELFNVSADKYVHKKEETASNIKARHMQAAQIIKESVDDIFAEETPDHSIDFDDLDSALDKLLD